MEEVEEVRTDCLDAVQMLCQELPTVWLTRAGVGAAGGGPAVTHGTNVARR
ncbi:hypothetical protein ACFWMJ_02905 [Streptomyces hawaiiensis]|uniref:hypothetical protein n=1 Tax=Streptomyces hawaiiensis TaxID=67305 RepID=UPI003655D71F